MGALGERDSVGRVNKGKENAEASASGNEEAGARGDRESEGTHTAVTTATVNAIRHASGELAFFYGTLNGYKQQWIFDSGASICFIRADECERLNLQPERAPNTVRIKHSSGVVEVTSKWVHGIRLGLGTGWGTLLDAYVVKQMPAVGLIIGLEYMFARDLHMRF